MEDRSWSDPLPVTAFRVEGNSAKQHVSAAGRLSALAGTLIILHTQRATGRRDCFWSPAGAPEPRRAPQECFPPAFGEYASPARAHAQHTPNLGKRLSPGDCLACAAVAQPSHVRAASWPWIMGHCPSSRDGNWGLYGPPLPTFAGTDLGQRA